MFTAEERALLDDQTLKMEEKRRAELLIRSEIYSDNLDNSDWAKKYDRAQDEWIEEYPGDIVHERPTHEQELEDRIQRLDNNFFDLSRTVMRELEVNSNNISSLKDVISKLSKTVSDQAEAIKVLTDKIQLMELKDEVF